jgi:hypothetical protein
MNSTNKNIRDLYRGRNQFYRGSQLTCNSVKDENIDQLVDFHNISNRCKNYFSSQLLTVHNVSDVRQREIHMAETSVPGPSPFEVNIATAKLKKYRSPGTDQTP